MSIKILIKETDPKGRAFFRDCVVTSKVLEKALRCFEQDNVVEIVGAIWQDKPISGEEIVKRTLEKFNKDFNGK